LSVLNASDVYHILFSSLPSLACTVMIYNAVLEVKIQLKPRSCFPCVVLANELVFF
jgi:hypothetical protein